MERPTFCKRGFFMENGQDVGSAGERVASVGTDGSRYTEYSLRGTTFGN